MKLLLALLVIPLAFISINFLFLPRPALAQDFLYEKCNSVPQDRKAECYTNPTTYNDEPCLSKENADYDSATCATKRAKLACAGKSSSEGYVYLRAFGGGDSGACVTFLGFTRTIVDYALLIAAIIAGFMFLRGGFKYTMSRGNPAGLMEARDQIMHATIGLVLLATAYIIILFLQGSFGYLGLNLVGPFGVVFGN